MITLSVITLSGFHCSIMVNINNKYLDNFCSEIVKVFSTFDFFMVIQTGFIFIISIFFIISFFDVQNLRKVLDTMFYYTIVRELIMRLKVAF